MGRGYAYAVNSRGSTSSRAAVQSAAPTSIHDAAATAPRPFWDDPWLHALALALIGVCWIGALRMGGGLQDYSGLYLLVAGLPLYLLGRGWRLPLWLHLAVAALPGSVALAALVRFDAAGVVRVTWTAAAALTFLGVAAWASSLRRRVALVVMVAGVMLVDLVISWLDWFAIGDPGLRMAGGMGWHNQLGIFLAVGAVLLAAWTVLAVGLASRLAALGAGILFVGVLLTGSRASLILLVAAWLLLAVVGWWLLRRWVLVRLLRIGLGVAFGLLLVQLPWWLAGLRAAPTAVLSGRYPIENSTGTRIEFWWNAIQIGLQNPLAGGGWGSYRYLARCFGPKLDTVHAHNEWLQAWAEGGVIGVLPPLVLLVAAVWAGLRRLRVFAGYRTLPAADRFVAISRDWPGWAALVATGMLLAHAMIDFDWLHPILLCLLALTAALAFRSLIPRRGDGPVRSAAPVAAILVALALTAGGYAATFLDPHQFALGTDDTARAEHFGGCPLAH